MPVLIAHRRVLVKRDDLCGFGRAGVKIRKLELLVAHVRARGYDTFVTLAPNVTNLLHDLQEVAGTFGMKLRACVADKPNVPAASRQAVFSGIDHECRLVGDSRIEAAVTLAGMMLRSRSSGERPFWVPPSIAHPVGVLGAARGYHEMVQQLIGTPDYPDRVFVTGCTGCTVAGFCLAEALSRATGHPPIRIHAVQVHPGALGLRIALLLQWTKRFLRLPRPVDLHDILELDDPLPGYGFGEFPRAVVSLCERASDEQQLSIDPIYGGKTWLALERWLDRAPRQASPLIWHCGNSPQWSLYLGPTDTPTRARGREWPNAMTPGRRHI